MARVGFLGLGVMGYHMAGHLKQAGHQTVVYNRTSRKMHDWVMEFGGESAATPALASTGCDAVFCCLGDDESVRRILLEPGGVLEAASPGCVVVDHTTASAALARELARACRDRGVGFVDAPVSGGEAGARNGVLTVMAGGSEADFSSVEPLIAAYARCVCRMGDAGSGQLSKMVNQICVAGVIAGLAEGLHFARLAGLDAAALVEVISRGAAQSWQMENRYRSMLAGHYEHGFAVDWMRKDLGIVLEEARANGARLPTTALIDQLYAEVQAMGGGRWDTSSLLARLEQAEPVRRGNG